MTLLDTRFAFDLPSSKVATAPAEIRGAGRDDVRLMVTHRHSGVVIHDHFRSLATYLERGDVLVVNTSATVPAAVDATTEGGSPLKAHFAGPAGGGLWQVEMRTPRPSGGTAPGPELTPQALHLPADAVLHLLAPSTRTSRLWLAVVEGPDDVHDYLGEYGSPVRYSGGEPWPIGAYQTVFATQPGSAEMPSAARPFTTSMVTDLVSAGVTLVPIILHAGVSSYEGDEKPGEERYEVPVASTAVINLLRSQGGRVIAVGTTVVRALETVADARGTVHPGKGTTDLVVSPARPIVAVDGLITGWHEPRSSHLDLLETFLPRPQLRDVYDEALAGSYLWHEFGDLLLILP